MKLDANRDFETHLGTLLDSVDDTDVAELLAEHTSAILSLAEESTRARRSPIVEAIRQIIESRLAEEVDGDIDGEDGGETT